MKRAGTILLLTVLIQSIGMAPSNIAQTSRSFSFNVITSENSMLQKGLSANSVYCVLQDRFGYLWFGTWDGLNKFDGYTFTAYDRKNGLSNETINTLLETDDGNLWIGTDEGLNFIDRKTDLITSFYHNPNDSTTINSNKINYIYQDKPGRIIVCTDMGLCTFDLIDFKARRYYNRESGKRRTRSNHINYFLKTSEETNWVATNFGLVQYNPKTSENVRHLHRPGDPGSLSNNRVRVVYQDTKNRIWIGTEHGLNLFNPANRTFRVFLSDPDNKASLSHDFVERIFEDTYGNFWIATDGGGLNLMNPETFEIRRIEMQSGRHSKSQTERIYSIFQDYQGNVWFGTFNGVFVMDKYKPKFNLFATQAGNSEGLHNDFIWSFLEFSPNEIWIGTDLGIDIFDPEKGIFKRLSKQLPQAKNLQNIRVRTMVKDNYNNVWIGTRDEGLILLELASGKTTFFQPSLQTKNSLSDNFILALFTDSEGLIWIGTNNGLNTIDPNTLHIQSYLHDDENPASISNNTIHDIYQDKEGRIWIATLDGLNLWNQEENGFITYKSSPDIPSELHTNRLMCLYEDSSGDFWIGTRGGGLTLFERKSHTFKSYTTDDGMPNNLVYAILEDNTGKLWMSTNWGITQMEKETESFISFDVTDGLQSNEFNAQAALKTINGKMLFGGMRGFNFFDPEKIKLNTTKPEILITSFKKFNQPQPGQLLNGDTIMLQYDENFFSFDFSALDYTNALRSKYAYKLINHSPEWTYVDGRKHFAEYTNVNPGTYTFRVIGANNNGIWNYDGISVIIIIKAPWYQTTLFRVIALVLFLFLLWYFINTIIQRGKRKNEMEKKVLQIEKQLFDIQQKALRLQMNPHFIFNSLNSVQSFILSKDIDLAVKYLSKFSQLMRLILASSLESVIPLSDEINALKHYLEIEKLRFDNKFEYSINIDPQVDEDFIGVPPMILQPYVENAIIHGLVNKPSNGSIDIKIDQQAKGILCTITDNGIGRQKAMLIKKSAGLNTVSKGMLITKERLEITNRDTKNKYNVKVTDLKKTDGVSAGTKVQIFIQTTEL